MRTVRSIVAIAIACLFGATSAVADPVEDFYRDKQVSLSIGYPPGGGYDSFARAVARHLPKYLPGRPAVIVRNMPGAGSLVATNYIANTARRDGTELAAVGREMATAKLFGEKNARFEATELNWIGNTESAATFCGAWHTAGFTAAHQLFERPLVVGGTTGDSTTVSVPLALNFLLNTKLKVISGYRGGADMHLALQRGEIEGRCAWSWSSLQTAGPTWIAEGKVRVLLGLGLERDPRFPDVPTAIELSTSPEKKQALELVLSQDILARPLVAPPGVPAERVAALRRAFDETVADEAFRAEVERLKLDLSPMSGAAMERIIRRLNATPQAVVELAVAAMKSAGATEKAP
jgi:tripartite-type tricarboxylate transporter receptor subunit TctC